MHPFRINTDFVFASLRSKNKKICLGVVRKLRHALGERGVGEFVTVQIQNFSLFGNFVTKVVFLRDVICKRPH